MSYEKTRPYAGTIPRGADGVLFDDLGGDPKSALYGWRIYRYKRPESREPWLTVKIASQRPRSTSANYWLSWNTQEKRFSQSRGFFRTPEPMRDAVAEMLSGYDVAFVPGEPSMREDAAAYMLELHTADTALS